MPVFVEDELIGYTAITAHWLDVGGKDPYSTDTVDVFQEGTLFPGVKLYRRGERDDDLYRTLLANCRVPKLLAGDLNAEIVGLRTGAAALVEDRRAPRARGLRVRSSSGCSTTARRRCARSSSASPTAATSRRPCSTATGSATRRSRSRSSSRSRAHRSASTTRGVPDALPGPLNCPQPGTFSSTRMALMMLAAGGEAPNDGHFRPIEVVTRPGSMFHPLPPRRASSTAGRSSSRPRRCTTPSGRRQPEIAPAWSGGDILTIVWWGNREATGEPWADGSPHPIGQGASARGDGASALHAPSAVGDALLAGRGLGDARPLARRARELAPDSGGPGRFRGGLGMDFDFLVTEDLNITAVIERTKNAPPGLVGGREGRANGATARVPGRTPSPCREGDPRAAPEGHAHRAPLRRRRRVRRPSERDPAAVAEDLREGYVSEEHARRWYPHAL